MAAEDSKKLDIVLNIEARRALDALAETDNTSASDHVREAIRLYFREKGIAAPVEVRKRGGQRKERVG